MVRYPITVYSKDKNLVHYCHFKNASHMWWPFSQVVGSPARILYAEQRGRVALAEAFNKAVAEETIKVR